jgi:hypothetical protein
MSLRFYPREELGKQGGNNPGADTTRRRIKKILSKGLTSHSAWRGFTTPARTAAVLGSGQRFFGSSLIPFGQISSPDELFRL